MNEFEICFRIVKRIGTITTLPSGWNKELNIVSWNDSVPKYDIREWDPTHERMSRGITLYEEEAAKLGNILAEHFAKEQAEASSNPTA